ncbi:MAG: 2-isopropylmalate synthase, partial [Thermoplasmata archaeon]
LIPEMVGQSRRIVMGKHTGKHAVSNFVKAKYSVTDEQIKVIVEKVKALSAKKKKILEDDVIAITEEVLGLMPEKERKVNLSEIVVVTGNKVTPTASVQLELPEGIKKIAAGVGVGPVDAAAIAIQKALGEEIRLTNYKLEAISGGTDSLASVEVTIEDDKGNVSRGIAVSGDIVMASVNALVDSINKLLARRS